MTPVKCGGPASRGTGTFLGSLLAPGGGALGRRPVSAGLQGLGLSHCLRCVCMVARPPLSSCGSLWGYSPLSPDCLPVTVNTVWIQSKLALINQITA